MTCTFCKLHENDSHLDERRNYMLRYGKTGACAHLVCLATRKGSEFVLSLRTGILEQLPFMLVRELGFDSALREELTKRSFKNPMGRAAWRA